MRQAQRRGGEAYVRYLRAFFDRWSPLYDAFAKPIAFAYRAAVRAAGAAPGRALLDLCTGTGELALRAAARGATVTAIDFTPSMLVRARAKGRSRGIRWLEMDARRLAFADGAFDVAVLSFALHDMPREVRKQALAEASRVALGNVVILDYELARGRALRLPVLRLLESFETAYLRGFVEAGGVAGALRDAGLAARRPSRPLPGLLAIWRSIPGAGPPRD